MRLLSLISSLLALAVTGAVSVANAAPIDPGHLNDGGRIAAALEAGDIDETEALWLRYLLHFEPDELPDEYRGEWVEAWRCSTVLVEQLKANRDRFDRERRARIDAQLAPWGAHPPQATPPPEDARPIDTCWGQFGEHRLTSTHFALEWDGDAISDYHAERFLESLELSWEIELDELGWRQPDGTNIYWMLVYIQENDYYSGAYTTVDYCGGSLMPYVVASSGSFWGSWYMDMAAHEFNHAIQFGYGFAHEFWWWEATATYVEEYVYPDHDGWAPYITGYSEQPWMAMNVASQEVEEEFYHMYGMAIMAFWMDEYLGGHDLIRDTWIESTAYEFLGAYGLYLPDLLDDMGYDFYAEYPSFMAANTVMEYTDQDSFPTIKHQEHVGELPASGESSSSTAPYSMGQNYIRFSTSTATDELPDLRVQFDGQEGGVWEVLLVGTKSGAVAELIDVPMDGPSGEARLADFGDYNRAWLVVSPRDQGSGRYTYEWSAEAMASLTAGDDDDDDDEGDDDDDEGGQGCSACSGGSGDLGDLQAAAALLLLFSLRRRT